MNEKYLPHRGLTIETLKFYNIQTTGRGDTASVIFHYHKNGSKIRGLNKKEFKCEGDMKNAGLFGQQLFNPGQGSAITICEGEYDAASAYQMLGSKYPSVSVRSASTARGDCERGHSFINSFDKIYLCFDNDIPGQLATRQVAILFDVNKVYHVKLNRFKDANDYLVNKAEKEFVATWWNSKRFLPKGIVSDYKEIEEILKKEDKDAAASYPFATLNSMCRGIRGGEVVLFTAQEKIGKTEVMRAIEYHLLKTTKDNLGIIHLEENERRTINGLISYALGVPCHFSDCGISPDERIQAYKVLTKSTDRCYIYSHFGSDDPDCILDMVRYLVASCHCKYIFLDHITMVVTGFEEEDERRKLDYISTRLAMMTRELDFTLFLVSHVNDQGKTRGSRYIAKVADTIVSLDRDIESPDAGRRNQTRLTVRGNRFSGTTGPAGTLVFDPVTWQVAEQEAKEEVNEPF